MELFGVASAQQRDASPCDATQAAYSTPDLATGDGTEVFHKYDAVDAADAADLAVAAGDGFVSNTLFDLGREISVSDRGSKVMTSFDGRGRVVAVATKAARPGVPAATLADRYAARWYVKKATFDEDDRLAVGRQVHVQFDAVAGGASRR